MQVLENMDNKTALDATEPTREVTGPKDALPLPRDTTPFCGAG